MKRFWKLAGIAMGVAILGAAALGAVAYAQDDDGSPFDFRARFREALASALGVTVEEYDAAVDQAQEQVVDEAVSEGWLTEEQAELMQWRMDQAPGFRMPGPGKGHGMLGRGMGIGGDNLLSVAADELGMSLTELLTELQDGKSIADVAATQGVDPQTIVSSYLAELQEDMDEAVAEGRITQNQADHMLQQAEERATNQVENIWEVGPHGFDGRRGGGRGFPSLGGF
jgi:polyhydroxyalkanoate synthesis regulator phasin